HTHTHTHTHTHMHKHTHTPSHRHSPPGVLLSWQAQSDYTDINSSRTRVTRGVRQSPGQLLFTPLHFNTGTRLSHTHTHTHTHTLTHTHTHSHTHIDTHTHTHTHTRLYSILKHGKTAYINT